ncbi:hypothetical protein F5Y18DRAFT_430137 [Xylariaceae sp. FL1019]|nr:hypothetical protein F5Y18DRAFT_430137 [Xylariaceae sp. FL1019]
MASSTEFIAGGAILSTPFLHRAPWVTYKPYLGLFLAPPRAFLGPFATKYTNHWRINAPASGTCRQGEPEIGSQLKVCSSHRSRCHQTDPRLLNVGWVASTSTSFRRFFEHETHVDNLITDSTKGAVESNINHPTTGEPPKFPESTLSWDPVKIPAFTMVPSRAEGENPDGVDHFPPRYDGIKDSYSDHVDHKQMAIGDDHFRGRNYNVIYDARNRVPPREEPRRGRETDTRAECGPANAAGTVEKHQQATVSRRRRARFFSGHLRACHCAQALVLDSGFCLADGRFIYADAVVSANTSVKNGDIGVFGDKLDEFDPGRWLKHDWQNG